MMKRHLLDRKDCLDRDRQYLDGLPRCDRF